MSSTRAKRLRLPIMTLPSGEIRDEIIIYCWLPLRILLVFRFMEYGTVAIIKAKEINFKLTSVALLNSNLKGSYDYITCNQTTCAFSNKTVVIHIS